jgi:SOS-response transcriptional repressor LexA
MTELQQAVLDFIHAHHEARETPPSTAAVLHVFRFRNEASVLRTLESLTEAGHLVRLGHDWKLKAPSVQLHFGLTEEPRLPPR